jgi:hypothetical protein
MTASVNGPPRWSSAVCFIFWSTHAETSAGLYFFPRISTQASPLSAFTIL